MHLLAHESSLGDEVINAASAMRIDPWRKGWWQTVWRALILLKLENLSFLPPSYPSESQQQQLVSQPGQHSTPGLLPASRTALPAGNITGLWCHAEAYASNPNAPFACPFALVSCWSPPSSQLITYILQTEDSPIIVTNATHPSSPSHSSSPPQPPLFRSSIN